MQGFYDDSEKIFLPIKEKEQLVYNNILCSIKTIKFLEAIETGQCTNLDDLVELLN
jgi:hypothetical protein